MTTRVHPPSTATSAISVFGRTYNPALGAQDVPDHDAQVLIANGWINAASGSTTANSGSTSLRPVNPFKNQTFLDSTLGVVIIFNGKNWVNSITGAVV
jgi:hypothetical protein